jgi:dihydroorotase
MVDLWLKDAKIVPENMIVSLGIEDGKIAALKKIAPKREECINLREFVILPGLIDAHVHFRDPGLTYKEDFRTGTMAAAAGGFTTIIDMPNTRPPTDTAKAFKEKLKIADHKSLVDYGLHAGVGKLKDIKNLFELKPASFKLYTDLLDDTKIEEIFKEIKNLKNDGHKHDSHEPLISLHCEDKETVNSSTLKLKSKGRYKPELYAKARPALAEIIAVSKALKLAGKYGLKIHICHVSTRESLELIGGAKKSDLKVTSEITPHHLLLNSSYLQKCGNFAKTNPPLRDKKDKLEFGSLNDVDIIGTDHAPHTIAEKEQNVWKALPGIPNLDATLPLLLTQIKQRNLTFTDLKRLLCENPARIFNIKNKGFIKGGMDADFVVVDMRKEGIIEPDKFKSKAKYSPFEGFKVKGMPVMTMVGGNVVMEDDYLSKNQGNFIYS